MKKLIHAIALAAILVTTMLFTVTSVSAVERVGSVTFHMTYQGREIGGGNLQMCLFAEPNDGDYQWTEEFSDCELHLFEYSEPRFAQELLAYIDDHNSDEEKSDVIYYDTKTIADDGTVRFDMLKEGLYLFWQTEPVDGYESLAPFVVSIPMIDGDEVIYDVNGSPKVNPQPIAATEAATEKLPPPDGKETLPQTGMLMWPIPGFFLYGTFFVLLGFIIRMD